MLCPVGGNINVGDIVPIAYDLDDEILALKNVIEEIKAKSTSAQH